MSLTDARQYHTDQVHYLRAAIAYTDAGATVSLGWVPPGAVVIGGGAVVSTSFNGTSPTVNIGFRNAGDGTTADPDDYASALALGTVGNIVADELATSTAYHPEGAEIAAAVSIGGSPSAGSGFVYVTFMVDNT